MRGSKKVSDKRKQPAVSFRRDTRNPGYEVEIDEADFGDIRNYGSAFSDAYMLRSISQRAVTATQLRQIADKLDQLNGVKKRRRVPTNFSGSFYIRFERYSKTRFFGCFRTEGLADEALIKKGWRYADGMNWTSGYVRGPRLVGRATIKILKGYSDSGKELEHPDKLPSGR